MKRYKRPTKEDFYYQVITLNKTNQKLCQYYGCSENVIHRWKRYYNIVKPIELVVKSYKAKSIFAEPGFVPWNKGLKGHLNSENCKKGWFKQEDLLKRAEKNIGKPQGGHETTKWMVCSTEDLEKYKNSQKKIGQRHKRIGYAQYVLKQAGIEIPKGYVVYHIDGNYANNDIGNLEIISRGELLKRNHSASLLAKRKNKMFFRFHRSSLAEAMETRFEFKDKKDLIKKIKEKSMWQELDENNFKCTYYGYDCRIGEDTYLIHLWKNKDENYVIGMASGMVE